MTSPYITFEEMEEGKDYIAFYKSFGTPLRSSHQPCCRNGSELLFRRSKTSTINTRNLVFIPVYTPPNSWDDMKRGDYLYVNGGFSQSDRNYWFRDDVLLRCSDEEWEAAGEYRKHLRQKAGGS